MNRESQQQIIASEPLGNTSRPGRALIGWMTDEEACLAMASRRSDLADSDEFRARAESARAAVQKRPVFQNNENPIFETDASLSEYISAFTTQHDFCPFAAEGWTIKIADLRGVCALQPIVCWDSARERTLEASSDDILSVAAITLPIRFKPDDLPVRFDHAKNTWIITSRNPNLRVVGNFSGPVEAGDGRAFFGCGFGLAVTASYVQVARFRSRHVLRDGYHRAMGLLSRGITHAPVLFRDFGQYENLSVSIGMLTEAAYLGERPPFLPDYLSGDVSTEIQEPASQRMILVQGIEMHIPD